jgi:hypothetical protein
MKRWFLGGRIALAVGIGICAASLLRAQDQETLPVPRRVQDQSTLPLPRRVQDQGTLPPPRRMADQNTLPEPRRVMEGAGPGYVAPVPAEMQVSAPAEEAPEGQVVPAGGTHLHSQILNRLRSRCCWSHHNSYSCGSLKSECVFIFGSCRAWYGEPCVKGPPPIAAPPGYPPLTAQYYGTTVPGEGHPGGCTACGR